MRRALNKFSNEKQKKNMAEVKPCFYLGIKSILIFPEIPQTIDVRMNNHRFIPEQIRFNFFKYEFKQNNQSLHVEICLPDTKPFKNNLSVHSYQKIILLWHLH